MKLSSLSNNAELRAYAQGTARQNISQIAEFLAPEVPVGKSVGHYKKYDDKHRFRVPNTRRAVGGNATVLGFNVTDETYNCSPHAIDVPVDKLEALEANEAMDLIKEGADDAAEVAGLAHEQTVIKLALTASGAGADYNFEAATIDPVKIIDEAILEVSKAAKHSNLMEIGLLFGPMAFLRYKHNAKVKERKTGGAKSVAINLEDVTQLQIGGVEARMSTMLIDTAAEGLDQDIEFMLHDTILIFVRKANPTRRDPSFMKTFRLRSGILAPRVYEREDGRVDVAAFDWSEDVQVTNTLAVKRINARNV